MKVSSKPQTSPAAPAGGSQWAKWVTQGGSLLPGLVLTSAIAIAAIALGRALGITVLNPLLIAVLLGIGWRHTVGLPQPCRPGVQFAMKRVLRLAVILLGLRLSMAQVLAVGPMGLIIVVSSTVSTFYLTCWLGRWLHINRKLTHLIAAGTSICGAAAVVATNAVVDSSEEDMTYAVATITGFGTLAMLIYPLLGAAAELSPETFGIWCGASIHEVAQVIATAFQNGAVSGELATITKLARVLLVIPIMVSLSYQNSPEGAGQRPRPIPIPWFVLFFCGLVIINSFNVVPEGIRAIVLTSNQFLLCMSLAALGLETNLARLTRLGMKPIYLAGLSWLFLALVSLTMIHLLYR
ncbi:MAG: YeiH family putative sulfate export transporter [Leptolyngbya sp. SIO1E4]|nr:YeiH family putative sulfate export transporter [Leptolyngbya sp. SIO1E4]